MTAQRHIVLGVTGGVAAYKAVDLASRLTGAGDAVRTVMTASACELIRPRSFEAVTSQAVYSELWSASQSHQIEHIHLVDWADVVVVAPATANILGKMAQGIADDLLSTLLCVCWQKPVLLAPAMNTRMWNNPAVQRNVSLLQETGFNFIGPEAGRLACGDEGPGRLAEVDTIIKAIEALK